MDNRARHQILDEIFPTVVRYLGVVVVVFYVIGRTLNFDVPDAVLIAAAGMIGYKTVRGAANGPPKKNGPANGTA